MLRASLIMLIAAAAHAGGAACPPCTCGVARGARVVGGEATTPGELPWLAALKKDDKVICGATILAKDHLITAAHCVHGIEASRLAVLVGEYDINNTLSEGYRVDHVNQHPNFNRYSYDNDIAVLRLAEPLPARLARPACLPDVDDDLLVGTDAIVSGWGSTVEEGPVSSIPMKVGVQVWDQDECSSAAYGKRKVTPRMLCANAPDRDACSGDSGGPLLLPKPYYTIIGIVSWGRGCARSGYPGVYTRMTSFLPWLQGALRHACVCEPPLF